MYVSLPGLQPEIHLQYIVCLNVPQIPDMGECEYDSGSRN